MDRHPVLKRHIFSLYNITPFLKVPLGVGVTQAEPIYQVAFNPVVLKILGLIEFCYTLKLHITKFLDYNTCFSRFCIQITFLAIWFLKDILTFFKFTPIIIRRR